MVRIKVHRIKSASLVETLVAMTILLVVLAMTITILVQVNKTSVADSSIAAQGILNEYILATDTSGLFFNETLVRNGFSVSREIRDGRMPGTVSAYFKVMDSMQIIKAEQKMIFRKKLQNEKN